MFDPIMLALSGCNCSGGSSGGGSGGGPASMIYLDVHIEDTDTVPIHITGDTALTIKNSIAQQKSNLLAMCGDIGPYNHTYVPVVCTLVSVDGVCLYIGTVLDYSLIFMVAGDEVDLLCIHITAS